MGLFSRNDSVARYKHLRAVSLGLPSKVLAATRALDFDMLKAAKKLTLPVSGRTLIFDGEAESAALMDFYFHEFRKGGRTLLDCCDSDTMVLSADERDLIEAHRQARTSLFEVTETKPREAQIRLRDVLDPDQPDVMLSDISMSSMGDISGKLLLFVRVVACQGIEMSSGIFFPFAPRHRTRLLDGYAGRMKTVPAGERSERRFIFFFQRHREFGEGQEFATPA